MRGLPAPPFELQAEALAAAHALYRLAATAIAPSSTVGRTSRGTRQPIDGRERRPRENPTPKASRDLSRFPSR